MTDEHNSAEESLRATLVGLDNSREQTLLAVAFQLTSEVAHLLGTPLNVIAGRAALLDAPDATDEKIASNVRRIQEQVEALTRRLERLLRFLEPDRQATRHRSASEIVDDAFRLYRPIAEYHRVQLEIRGEPAPLVVEAHTTSVILNALLSLAIRSTKGVPHVFLEARVASTNTVVFGVTAPGAPAMEVSLDEWQALERDSRRPRQELQLLGICAEVAKRRGGHLDTTPGTKGLGFELHCPAAS